MKRILILGGVISLLLSQNLSAGNILKGGLRIKPSDGEFAEKWLLAFEKNYSLASLMSIGYEIQGAYHKIDDSFSEIMGNVFLKGKVKLPTLGFGPFIGGGIGLISNLSFNGETDWNIHTGFELGGGLELGVGGVGVLGEIMAIKSFKTGSKFSYYILAGIKF
ncbi:MAG: hypothetical protein ACE5WD_07105 [Candidatus Aminicenantia bacterium]